MPIDKSPAQPSYKRTISGTQLKAARCLKFVHGEDGSLKGVEFETHPLAKVLNVIFDALSARRVYIVDSATRITRRALSQRMQLSEMGGAPLVGARRFDIEGLFVEALSGVTADEDDDYFSQQRVAG
jgi:hypothetical protein